jgi:riboflavin kinase/FMN adenylyltransferase
MRVFRDQDHRDLAAATVVTVGVFDGVHLGHGALVERCRAQCRPGEQVALVTFEPMPMVLLDPARAPARLVGVRQKLELLRAAGVDLVWMMRFNHRLAATSAQDFAGLLKTGLNARHVVVGPDFRFGCRREGDFGRLEALGAQLGFTAERVSAVHVDGERVSSTAVRSALAAGDLAMAARLLGRPYTLLGRVIAGRALGRTLGYPTANLRVPGGRPALAGIFAIRARADEGDWRDGVANLGSRPAVGGGEPLLEAHLFDFDGDLYGRRLEVAFIEKLRDEAHFEHLDDLVIQMKRDEAQARDILAAASS